MELESSQLEVQIYTDAILHRILPVGATAVTEIRVCRTVFENHCLHIVIVSFGCMFFCVFFKTVCCMQVLRSVFNPMN